MNNCIIHVHIHVQYIYSTVHINPPLSVKPSSHELRSVKKLWCYHCERVLRWGSHVDKRMRSTCCKKIRSWPLNRGQVKNAAEEIEARASIQGNTVYS